MDFLINKWLQCHICAAFAHANAANCRLYLNQGLFCKARILQDQEMAQMRGKKCFQIMSH